MLCHAVTQFYECKIEIHEKHKYEPAFIILQRHSKWVPCWYFCRYGVNLVLGAAGSTGTIEGFLSDIGGDDIGKYQVQIEMENTTVSCPQTEVQLWGKQCN